MVRTSMSMNRQCCPGTSHPGSDVGRAPTSRVSAPRLVLAMALLSWAPAAAAQKCSGLAATNLVFTNYTPFGPGVSATSTLTYTCDPGVTQAWIGIFDQRSLGSAGNRLQYELYTSADRSAVWPDAPPLPVPASPSGSVTVYAFLPPQDAAAGSYSGTQRVVLYTGSNQAKTDQTVMQVTAIIAPACTIGAGTLAFGGYDPIVTNATAPLDAQGAFQVACTRNTAYAVGLGPGSFASGATRRMANGADRLAYELYSDPGRTAVWSAAGTVAGTAPSIAPVTLTVYGRIPGGQSVAPGAYADTVQSTINF
jgi:spore coat protein U domain-containing protein, fimbrial subunit CupE1/2/3/6